MNNPVCAKCGGTGVIGDGPTSFNKQPCNCSASQFREPYSPTVKEYPCKCSGTVSMKMCTDTTCVNPPVKESETGEQEDKPAVTITLYFDVPTFGKFISLMRTNDELWPDFKESLMQLKDKIESWKEMK